MLHQSDFQFKQTFSVLLTKELEALRQDGCGQGRRCLLNWGLAGRSRGQGKGNGRSPILYQVLSVHYLYFILTMGRAQGTPQPVDVLTPSRGFLKLLHRTWLNTTNTTFLSQELGVWSNLGKSHLKLSDPCILSFLLSLKDWKMYRLESALRWVKELDPTTHHVLIPKKEMTCSNLKSNTFLFKLNCPQDPTFGHLSFERSVN